MTLVSTLWNRWVFMYWELFDEILPFTGLNLILTQDDGTTFCFGPGDDVPFCKDPTTAAPTTTTTTTTTTAGAACVCAAILFYVLCV